MILKTEPSVLFEIIREMTERDNNLLNITWLCEIAGVSRGGYYKWLAAEQHRVQIDEKDKEDFKQIVAAYRYRGYDKGAAGIHMRLLHLNPPVLMNHKKIRRLMRKYDLYCPIRAANPYRRMAKAMRTSHVAPNLLNRKFRAYGPRTVLLTDITYISRGESKFTYLSVIMDAFTKEILAFTLSISLEVDFVMLMIQDLFDNHKSELKTDTLIHSDQGCHYTSNKFIDIFSNCELRQSMSRRGNCWDNAPQESFFGHMKDEIHLVPSDRHPQIVKKVTDWITYYNNERYQIGLKKLSPVEFYNWCEHDIWPLPYDPPPKPSVEPIPDYSDKTGKNTEQAASPPSGGQPPDPRSLSL
jgi:transposase InsO family protein